MTSTCRLPVETLTSLPCGRVRFWVDQADHRGTFDIVWSTVFTMFICTYTILCLNVPAPKDTWWKILRRRIMWMGLGILGPEFVLTFAAGQWSRARQSVEDFRDGGYIGWNIRHAFFADMGGFVLCAQGCQPFPLNAKQLHWLVVNGHVAYPQVPDDEIRDRSKQDTVAKLVTAFQVGYLVVQTIGRRAQDLTITALELNTLAVVVCSLMTSYTWLRKPVDVQSPTRIEAHSSMEAIHDFRSWSHTPLDFVDENGPGWAMNIQPFMKMPVIEPERPIQRIPNDRFPMNAYGNQEYYLCFATLIFSAVHVAGWNFSFPSRTEQILWRVSSMLLFGITVAFWILETVASWKRLGRWKLLYLAIFKRDKMEEFRRARAEKLPEATEPTVLPLPWEFWTIFPLALLYGFARMFLLVEGFAELRAAPSSAFVSVNWSQYWPHM